MKALKDNLFLVCIVEFMLLFMALIGASRVYASTNGAMINAFDNFSSTSYVLMDFDSSRVLVQFNDRERMPVASICKLMTSLITLEKIDSGEIALDDMVLVSTHAAAVEGSQAFLDAGSEYSVGELLKSVVIASANDSAIALAEHIAGSEEGFVRLMNDRANELGMADTNYTNATGLTTKDQYSTAYDTCLILREINKHEVYGEFAKIWMDSLTHPSGRVTELVNTNRLIKYYPYCLDGKTGFTDEAGYCLSSVAEKDGSKLIAVTLNCENAGARFYESMKLFDYGFANYSNHVLIDKDEYKVDVKVNRGKMSSTKLGVLEDLTYLCDKAVAKDIELIYNIPNVIEAGIKSGSVVGEIVAYLDNEMVARVEVVTIEDIEKQGFGDIMKKIAKNFTLKRG